MQLLDDNLWFHFTAGRISAEEAIDKSKNPGLMVDKMQRQGIMVKSEDEALLAEAEEAAGAAGGAAKPAAGGDADKAKAVADNRARMQAMMGKK